MKAKRWVVDGITGTAHFKRWPRNYACGLGTPYSKSMVMPYRRGVHKCGNCLRTKGAAK